VSFRPKKRYQTDEFEQYSLEQPSGEERGNQKDSTHHSEEVISLDEIFKPEELKWNRERESFRRNRIELKKSQTFDGL
jgi:NAD-dependent DNA ligase